MKPYYSKDGIDIYLGDNIQVMTYLAKLISTPTGGVLLDPFAGSCSTLVACKRLGRKAIGIEKEKAYIDIGIERLEHTMIPLGKKP